MAVRQADIGIEDKEAVKTIKEGARLYDMGRYGEALEKLSQAGVETESREDKLKIAGVLSRAGSLLLKERRFSMAISYFERSLEIYRTLDYKPGLAKNYSYLGKAYTDMGKYEDGIGHFKRAIETQEELGDKAGIAHNLNNVANLYSYLGDYRESIGLLEYALSISEGIREPTQEAKTLINLGTINLRLRNYKKSIEYLDRAFEVADKANEENLKAQALSIIGVIYRHQGNYGKALENYRMALEINEGLGLKAEIATSLSIVGELYKELGNYDEALKYLERSLAMSEKSKDRLMTAVNLNYMGEVKHREGRYKEALNLYDSSLEIFEELGFKDRIARSLNNIGYLKGEIKDWNAAIENLDKAIAIYRELGDREWIRVSLFGRGVFSEEKGDLASAEKNYKEAVDVFESIRRDVSGGEEAERLFSDVNVKVYERLVSLLIRLGKREEALKYIERSRSKTLRDTLLESGINSFDERTRGLLERFDGLFRKESSINYELVRERTKPSPNLEKIDNLVKTLAQTRKEFSQIASRLKIEHPELYSLLSVDPETILDLKREGEIPPNVVFVEYFITDKETYVFLIGERDLNIKRISITKEELNRLVMLFRRLIETSKSIPTNSWLDDGTDRYRKHIAPLKDVSVRLYHYLIEPIEGEISHVETVAIVPFGPLHYLPFHALGRKTIGGGLEFLVEKKNLVYLVSTSINYLDTILRDSRRKGISSIVAFGNPDLGEPELALPYSENEVLTIKEIFPNTTVFLEKDATKENFKNSWGRSEIIHLAAHGILQEEPSILLAPLGSGSLTLSDITGLPPARNTHLVVLSSCEAAIDRNESNPTGAELSSMALAFSMVGTPSVIATLWRVDDRVTFELMESFYRNLKNQGRFGYEALRKAQINMLKRPDRYGEPFYWAPFVLIGMWR